MGGTLQMGPLMVCLKYQYKLLCGVRRFLSPLIPFCCVFGGVLDIYLQPKQNEVVQSSQSVSYFERSEMFVPKYSKEKRPRFSESRQVEKKTSISAKKGIQNNRSSSLYREKRQTRFNTEYDQRDPHTTNLNQLNNLSKFQKKNTRKNTQDIYQEPYRHLAVHSTKYNPQKNIELRGLFGKPEDKSLPKKNKSTQNNHPLLKFMGKKQNEKRQSICSRPQPRNLSQHPHEYSLSIYKQKKQSAPKRPLLVDKNQISLRDQKQDRNDRQQHFQRNKEERYHLLEIQKHQGQRGGKTVKKQDQSTVKTIKKHKEDVSDTISNESYGLTEEEEETFGDRFPYGFEKIKLLGRGGFSLVWLGRHIKSGREFAIKQIITQNTHQTHIKEIWFGTMFFSLGGVPKPEFSRFPGVKNLVRLYSYEINQTDTWIFYQKCGKSLGSVLYDIKSQKLYGQQKLYKIHYKALYQAMAENPNLLLSLIIEICKPLVLLAECEVVHSDLKTENILLQFKEGKESEIKEVKLIDYGSSFQFRNLAQFSMATPQYMPPEILNYIIHENGGEYQEDLYQRVMNNYKHAWAVDMWSLGCVVLEIVVGVPLWMSLPLLVPGKNGSWLQKEGLFAVKGRLFPQIIKKQRNINPLLEDILEKDNYSRIALSPTIRKTVRRMLQVDFNKRISPQQVIQILEKQMIAS